MNLILPEALEAAILAEAKAAYPRECCGLIEGVAETDGFAATALHPARNLARAPDRFEIDPADHIAAAKAARSRGHAIIGCYHSHPNGKSAPSVHDRAQAGEEEFLWLIAATDGAACSFAAYRVPGFAGISLIRALGADLVTSSSKERR